MPSIPLMCRWLLLPLDVGQYECTSGQWACIEPVCVLTGTPTSVKSVSVVGHHSDGGSLPPSAKAARYGRGAFDNESVLSEAILEEEPDQDDHGFEPDQENRGYEPHQGHHGLEAHQQNHSFEDHTHYSGLSEAADALQHEAGSQAQHAASSGVDVWQHETGGDTHAAEQDGWDFDASALDDLPSALQQQEHGENRPIAVTPLRNVWPPTKPGMCAAMFDCVLHSRGQVD